MLADQARSPTRARSPSWAAAHRSPRSSWALSDDDAALTLGTDRLPRVEVRRGTHAHHGSLVVCRAAQGDLDRYMLELGRGGVAVRRLSVQCTSLHAAFRALTAGDDPLGSRSVVAS